MNRRRLLIAGAALAAIRGATRAQNRSAVPRVGLLWIQSDSSDSGFVSAFRAGLAAEGFVDKANVAIDTDSLVDRYERLPEAVRALLDRHVDVIVAYGATATVAAHDATSVAPIVMLSGTDPVRLKLVASLSKPGGNVTGITLLHPDLDAKRLELLNEAVPGVRRVALLLNPSSATESGNIARWQAAAARLQLRVQPVEIRLQRDIDPVIATLSRSSFDAIAVVGGTMFVANRRQIVDAIARTRLPASYGSAEYPEVGGLMSYGPNVADGFRRAAGHVASILRGARPADIPVEQASKFELVINARTAKALGLEMSRSVLLRADRIID